MTRNMYDSVTSADIPDTSDLVAGYVDGNYRWSAADWDRHRGKTLVRIAVFATTNDGHVLDVEPGNATPAQSVSWIEARRKAGVSPTIYGTAATVQAVKDACEKAGVTDPEFWLANWDGKASVPAGYVAKQYKDSSMTGGHYDVSVVADHWPGVDGVASAPKPSKPGAPSTTYVVKKGDTLSSIAATYGTTWQAIYDANRGIISNPDLIYPGQKLELSGTRSVKTYTVKSGDTLSGIASKCGTTWQAIYNANHGSISDPDLIYPGQELVIP